MIASNFFDIQNSYVGIAQFSYNTKGCAMSFAPVFQPIKPSEIKPGMKVYNYEQQGYFTLMGAIEINTFASLLKFKLERKSFCDFKKLTIQSNTAPLQIKDFTLNPGVHCTHYPKEGGTAMFGINDYMDKNNQVKTSLYYAYNFSQKNIKTFISFGLDDIDLSVMIDYLDGYKNYISTFIALQKYDSVKFVEENNKNNNNKNAKNNYGNYGAEYVNNSGFSTPNTNATGGFTPGTNNNAGGFTPNNNATSGFIAPAATGGFTPGTNNNAGGFTPGTNNSTPGFTPNANVTGGFTPGTNSDNDVDF